jgi:hypothetical protein
MDLYSNLLIQTLLGEDTGQYTTKLFGANDEGTFDVRNAEARRAKNAQRKEELQREIDGDCVETEVGETGPCQFSKCTTCGDDYHTPNELTKVYLRNVEKALSASNRGDIESQKLLKSVPLRTEQRPTSTNLDDYVRSPVYIFSPHEGLPKGNLLMFSVCC